MVARCRHRSRVPARHGSAGGGPAGGRRAARAAPPARAAEPGTAAGRNARGAMLLADLHVDWQPAGWRLVPRPGTEERRARDLLARDLDAFQEVAGDVTGPVKVQTAGPWTLAAGLELPRGDKVLRDPGAVRDLGVALAEGLVAHVRDLRRRQPAT